MLCVALILLLHLDAWYSSGFWFRRQLIGVCRVATVFWPATLHAFDCKILLLSIILY